MTNKIDCACVIHGDGYNWIYVERLYNMLTRNLSCGINFHVYTEAHRAVPDHMIKHELVEYPGVSGPKRSWWYKMQLFNAQHHQGDLLYFDLDVVIVDKLDWIPQLSTNHFWTIRDFRHLQRSTHNGINSSVMWWNVPKFAHVWNDFATANINQIIRENTDGDQQYIARVIPVKQRRNFDGTRLQSWRWEVSDGGFDFQKRCPKLPGTGANINPSTSIVVFHGKPKPHQVTDPVIVQHWQ